MKKIIASILLIVGLIMTSGCSKSDDEQIKELVDTKIEIIEGNDVIKKVDVLLHKSDLKSKLRAYNNTWSCVKYEFRKYNNPYGEQRNEVYKDNVEFYSKINKESGDTLDEIKELNKIKGFKSDKFRLEERTTSQEDFKQEYDVFKKNYFDEVNKRNPKLTSIIFPSDTSHFKDGNDYTKSILISLFKETVIKNINEKYPKLANECIKKVLKIKEISTIGKTVLNEEENKAEVTITYSDESTKSLNFVKYVVKNEGHWKEVLEQLDSSLYMH